MKKEQLDTIESWILANRDKPKWLEQPRTSLISGLTAIVSQLRSWQVYPSGEASAMGILLTIVREEWGDPSIGLVFSERRWWIVRDGASYHLILPFDCCSPYYGYLYKKCISGDDEVSTLLAALDAAVTIQEPAGAVHQEIT